MENRKMEFMARIKPILDKAQTKRDFEEFQELFDEIKVDLDEASLKKIGEMFNQKLAELGKQQIVLSDITVGKGALEALTTQFVSAIKTAFVDGVQDGIEDAAKQMSDKKLKLEQLVNQKGELEAKQAKLKKNVSQKTKIESIKDFRPNETTAKDMGDTLDVIKTKMREAIDKFNELADKVPHQQLSKESDKDYAKRVMSARTSVIDARQYLDELIRMNLSVSGHRGALAAEAPDLWAEWKEVMDEDGGLRWQIEDAWAVVEDIYDRSADALEQYKKRLDAITSEINSLTAELGSSSQEDVEHKKRGRPKKVQEQTRDTTGTGGATGSSGGDVVGGDTSGQIQQENKELQRQSQLYDELIKKAAQYKDIRAFTRENIKDLMAAGIKSSAETEKLWKEAKYQAFTPVELSKEDAIQILQDKVPDNILDGWFRGADSSYKKKLEELALSDTDIRNAALNIMWSNFKEFSGKDIDFNEFLNSEIPVYRGKNSEKYVDGDEILSFSFDENIAKKFGQHVLETIMRPIDTIGSYQTTAESEVFLPRNQLESRPEYQQWHNKMAGIDAGPSAEEVENARKVAEEAEKERLAKEAAEEAAKQKRIEEEAAAEAARAAAELAEQERLAREAAAEAAEREAAAKAEAAKQTPEHAATSLADEYERASDEVKQLVQDIAKLDDLENPPTELANMLASLKELAPNMFDSIFNSDDQWEALKGKLNASIDTANADNRVGAADGGGADPEELKATQERLNAAQSELDSKTRQLAESEEAMAKASADKADADKRANDALAEADRLREELANKDKQGGSSIGDEALQSFLTSTVFNVKVQSDDNESQSEAWALESTLQTVKGVLDSIQTNTANAAKSEGSIDSIAKAVEAINGKLTKGESSSKKQPSNNNQGFDKKTKQELYRNLQDRSEELGKLEAMRDVAGNIETKEKAESLQRAIDAEAKLIGLTKEEIELLDLRRKASYDNYAKDIMSPDQQEQVETVNKLKDLYKQLGRAEANLRLAGDNEVEKGFYTGRVASIQANIEATKEQIAVNDELQKQLDDIRNDSAKDSSAEAAKAGLKTLEALYKQLGKAQADAEMNPYSTARQENVDAIKSIINSEKVRLGLNQEQYQLEIARLEKLQESAKLQQLRSKAVSAENAELAKQKKIERDNNRVSKADSLWRTGADTIMSLWRIDDDSIDTEELPAVKNLKAALKDLNDVRASINANGGVVKDEDVPKLKVYMADVEKHTEQVRELIKNYEFLHGSNSQKVNSPIIPGANIEQQLTKSAKAFSQGKAIIKSYSEETGRLTAEWVDGERRLVSYTFAFDDLTGSVRAVKGVTKTLPSLWESVQKKMKDAFTYLTGFVTMERIFGYIRQGIVYVKELDTALTQLKKVTDETQESYDKFLERASKTANRVGTTVTDLVNSTGDWSRLGYSLKEAESLAESTAILLNVSEFSGIDEATNALISTMQAFGYAADDSMHVVDIMNEIGNNYAVSSNGIATALQESASALSAANNSYQESVAMIAAANKTTQDVSKVGGALRTISLRLRGTEVDGEDNDGLITSKSKLQSKIKSLSGVDILTKTGEYRSTYEVLLDISKVFNEMNDMDQAECCLYVQKCA